MPHRYASGASDKAAMYSRMLRVDHAGEYGANRIYEGQLAVLGSTPVKPVLQEMLDQEKEHLRKFNEMLPQYQVRPTALLPVWHVAGYALGKIPVVLT